MAVTVETMSGRVQGRLENAAGPVAHVADPTGVPIRVFRGIPYATPPVGPLRLRATEPVRPWAGVLDATAFGPSAVQSATSPFSGVIPGNHVADVSEDCLSLNIWAPEQAAGLPVLVWVHGGAFLTGGTCIETYDGAALAAGHEVIVVSVNYRVGVLGFLWLGDHGGQRHGAASNCGLRDVLTALEWVRANISAFGGDPANITAFGESAGAGALLHLLSSPASRGLMRRCVLQSPGVDHTLQADDAARATAAVLAHLGLDGADVGRLWDLPGPAILDAQEKAVIELMSVVSSMPLHPVVDGDFLPTTPSNAFRAGAGAEVDLLVSWTAEEMRLFPDLSANEVGQDGLIELTAGYLARRSGQSPDVDRARDLVTFYEQRLAPSGRTAGADVWAAIQTDGVMRLPARRIADDHAANGGETYAVEFAWPARGGEWERGAFHAIDLPFTFGTLDRCGWAEFLRAGPGADRLAATHMAAWAAFAADGSPATVDLQGWERYDANKRVTMVLDDTCAPEDDPLGPVAAAWEDLWSPDGRAATLR